MPGFGEIVFLVLLALLIFGPTRLPDVARSAGKALSSIKREASSTLEELKAAADADDLAETANDLRATAADLERSASLGGRSGARSPAGAAGAGNDGAHEGVPVFDTDAT